MREILDVGGRGVGTRGDLRVKRARRGVVQRGLGGESVRPGANGACPRGGAPIAEYGELGTPATGDVLFTRLRVAEGDSPRSGDRQAERAQ